MIRLMLLVVVLGVGAVASAQEDAPGELARRAGELVARAEQLDEAQREERDRLLLEAAGIYRRLSDDRSVRSAELERTLGTTLLVLGETGRAVLHLRRAERLDPTDAAIRESLEAARDRVRSGVAPSVGSRVRSVALWWRGHVRRDLVLVGTLGAWVLGWTFAAARRARRWDRGAGVAGALLGVAVLGAGMLGSEHWLDMGSREAVLVEDGVLGYNGPSSAVYPATFSEPMRAGMELRVLDRREGWARVELRNGQETWVPVDSVEMVTPGGRAEITRPGA